MSLKAFEKEGKLLKTFNRMGHSITQLTEYSLAFIDFSKSAQKPVLDIGAAFGVCTIPALEAGARVIANDIDQRHLDIIKEKTPASLLPHLELKLGRLPDQLDFEENSLSAIHASQVFHFLTGDEITIAFKKIFKWLTPGGKFFLIASSPYVSMLQNFIPTYLERKQSGEPWPGMINDLSCYTNHPVAQDNPPFFNFLDQDILERALLKEGFTIEKATLFNRIHMPDHIKLDGRENVGVIAVKPL